MRSLVILFLLLPVITYAQYVAEAPLSEVKSDGFYSIVLPPKVTASLELDLSNIRILDPKGVEVPYITREEPLEYNNVEWKPIRIEKSLKENCCTVITLFNDDKSNINNFLLQVKNAEINKSGRLRGSDDGKTWYAVLERFKLDFGKYDSHLVTEVFDFPLNNYAYLQLTINDSTTSPLNVVGALRTSEDIVHGGFIEIPDSKLVSVDSVEGHATWATISFDTAQYVDRFEFDIEGPKLYKRKATLFRKVEYILKGKQKTQLEELQSFDVVSGQAAPVNVFSKGKEFYVRVANDNNPPLKFNDAVAYQLKRSLIAYLEKDKSYKLALGDELQAPGYDLKFFTDSIPARPSELVVGKLTFFKAAAREESPTYFTNRSIIWVAIIAVAILLGFMSVRMLREK